MNSWDMWDTLVARFYKEPRTIFEEIGKREGIPPFSAWRKEAEQRATVKTLDGIYSMLQQLHGMSDKQVARIKDLEVQLEHAMTYPIACNANRVGPDDVVYSDMYLSKDVLLSILHKNGIYPRDLKVTYGGKHNGWGWDEFIAEYGKPDLHTGDNKVADFEQPQKKGIKSAQFLDTQSPSEQILDRVRFPKLSHFVRAMRLSNPYPRGTDAHALYLEQATINIPVLVLASIYLAEKYGGKKLLFLTREAASHFRVLFEALYPNIRTDVLYASRKTFMNPSDSYLHYGKSAVQDDCVLVDSHGSGMSTNNFLNMIGKRIPFFYVVGYNTPVYPLKDQLVLRTTIGWSEIEDMNIVAEGSVIDVEKHIPVRLKGKFPPNVFIPMYHAILDAGSLITKGFDLTSKLSPREPAVLRDAARQLLAQVRVHKCHIHRMGFGHMNDHPYSQQNPKVIMKPITYYYTTDGRIAKVDRE